MCWIASAVEEVGRQNSEYRWALALLAFAPRGWFSLEKLYYNRMFQDYFLPTLDVPGHRVYPERCQQSDAYLTAAFNSSPAARVLQHRFFSSFLLPALGRVVQKSAFVQTGTDTALVACALERYRLAHGQFPATLDALAPEFINRVPHDVINGQPLKYRRTPDGQYVLYSVGWNQTDDGGAPGLSESGASIDQARGDWVWRLPARL